MFNIDMPLHCTGKGVFVCVWVCASLYSLLCTFTINKRIITSLDSSLREEKILWCFKEYHHEMQWVEA